MNDPVTLSYVLPVHNDADVLAANVEVLVERLAKTTDAEIVLVENGSRDWSWEACEALSGVHKGVHVLAYREGNAGLGYAYARGLAEVVKRHGPAKTRWTVLTGTDFPLHSAISTGRCRYPWRIDPCDRGLEGASRQPGLGWLATLRDEHRLSSREARRARDAPSRLTGQLRASSRPRR